ncbi:MAG: hypothetical protein WEG36_10330 [Gemmatimonadota bacterium]
MRLVATRKSHQNHAVLDPWTVVHFSTGLALGLMDLRFDRCMAAATAYEVVEQVVERQKWGQELFKTKVPESPMNAILDLAVFAAGHWIGTRWNRT